MITRLALQADFNQKEFYYGKIKFPYKALEFFGPLARWARGSYIKSVQSIFLAKVFSWDVHIRFF